MNIYRHRSQVSLVRVDVEVILQVIGPATNFFAVLACHKLVLDGFDQLSRFFHCTVHCISSVRSINPMMTSITRKRQESILGPSGVKRERYLCYADPLTTTYFARQA